MTRRVVIAVLLCGCASSRSRDVPPVVLTPAPAVDSVPLTSRSDPFAKLTGWLAPTLVRMANGGPGPAYWQQRADYAISALLDTAARRVSGELAIHYTNASPDTLRVLWLQLDQNLYRQGSLGSRAFPAESRWGDRGFDGGYALRDVRVDGRSAAMDVADTRLRIDLDAPLLPGGGTTTITMGYSFPVPEHGSDRMGRDGALYEIAQWYPRMAVYDDVRGWNTDPYLGQGEFYLEYGDIDYSITAPAGYTIAGTGILQNPGEVLTAGQIARLERASMSGAVEAIISRSEARAVRTSGTKTWRFRAEQVRDVAWAGAPDFRWDATSWNGIAVHALYQWPKAGPDWESAAEYTRWAIRTYSERLAPYPYPQATSIAGPVGGMEYPMLAMVHYSIPGRPTEVFRTIDHEHGHEWFPMLVGSNERRYAWQDEGINTFINTFSIEARYPGSNEWPALAAGWAAAGRGGTDTPMMTPADLIDPEALGAVGYWKPAAVLFTLRNHIMGPDVFDGALREYVRRWAFRHPTPEDFFRTMEDASGEDLSWFWRGFFYTDDLLDVGIDGVATAGDGPGGMTASLTLRRATSIVFSVALRIKYAGGSTEDRTLPVRAWAGGERIVVSIPVRERVVGVRLWPDPSVPDWNTRNNTWGDAPPADTFRSVSGR